MFQISFTYNVDTSKKHAYVIMFSYQLGQWASQMTQRPRKKFFFAGESIGWWVLYSFFLKG